MILFSWWGCGAPEAPVAPVDDGSLVVRLTAEELRVGERVVGPAKLLEQNPTDEDHPALVAALAEASVGHDVRIEVLPDTPFWKLRQLVGSARTAGVPSWSLSVTGSAEVLPWQPPARYGIGTVCKAPVPVSGVEPLVTLSVQTGVDGAWVLATAAFLPIGPKGPVDGYEPECLAVPPCDQLFPDGALRTACAEGAERGAERRVELGGQYGCLLPIARTPELVSEWRALLPDLAKTLGLPDRLLLVVMPEARVRADALMAVLGGLHGGGVDAPVGATMLVEGNDGPPVCSAVVRDRATFDAAGARWLGSLTRPTAPAAP